MSFVGKEAQSLHFSTVAPIGSPLGVKRNIRDYAADLYFDAILLKQTRAEKN